MSKKETTPPKKTNSDGMLPKMELLIIFVLFLSFIVWAMSKCSSTQEAYRQKEEKAAAITTETTAQKAEAATAAAKTEAVEQKSTTRSNPEKITVLYVILDGLKLRKGPHLDSAIVRTLKLNKEVYFLNETTDFKQKINLGDRVALEPWIKVRSYTGHEGWVYGAGVHYFKPSRVVDTLEQE